MDDRKKQEQHKSKAKATGVKSVLVDGKYIYTTSFGKGNEAVLENKIYPNEPVPEKLRDRQAYEVKRITDATIEIKGSRFLREEAVADKPNHSARAEATVRQDMLCLKDALETRFFGRTFDDNVHIQVIYNILDIEKIIAEYATNAVFALNNLCRSKNGNIDVIGNISTTVPIRDVKNGKDVVEVKGYIEKNEGKPDKAEEINLLKDFPRNERLGYFSNAFFIRKRDDKNGDYVYVDEKHREIVSKKRKKSEIYQVLELIGSLRQWSFHGGEKADDEEQDEEQKNQKNKVKNDRAWLYRLDTILAYKYKYLLEDIYIEATARINSNFEPDNIVNIRILDEIFTEMRYAEIVKEYYDFLVTKKHKNMGFSIKILREIMLNDTDFSSDPDKKNKKYDSVRSKLYKLIDFVLYHGYLNEDKGKAEELVDGLRSCMKEEIRAKIYAKEAARLWEKYEYIISQVIADKISGENIQSLQNSETGNVNLGKNAIDSTASYFTELMYLLTAFIDGKEINDLLTTLVHKFDNISSLLDVMKKLDMETGFVEEYKFFDNSKQICEEMVVLNSFARMCPVNVSAKKVMYRDALDILGIESSMSEEELDRILCRDKNGKLIKDENGNKKSGMSNFIASNVVKSTRFKYLVRYGNSKKIHNLAKCESAVLFVLNGIPDAQIERYYVSVSCRKPEDEPVWDLKGKRAYLAKMIGEMSFEQFKVDESIQQAKDPVSAKIKERYKAIVRMYLTVMYLMLKNLVNINSRYVMAFHCLERDAVLYDAKLGKNLGKNWMKLNEFVMGIEQNDHKANGELKEECPVERAENAKNRHFRGKKGKKWYDITYTNMRNSSKELTTAFRNTVAHVNALRNIDENIQGMKYANSYFEMYHYIIQRDLERKYDKDGKGGKGRIPQKDTITKYTNDLNDNSSYRKDFVKAYCVPLAYNVVRYKNLTIDGLFDRNNFKGDEKEEKKED